VVPESPHEHVATIVTSGPRTLRSATSVGACTPIIGYAPGAYVWAEHEEASISGWFARGYQPGFAELTAWSPR
jgi:hypothetical protein